MILWSSHTRAQFSLLRCNAVSEHWCYSFYWSFEVKRLISGPSYFHFKTHLEIVSCITKRVPCLFIHVHGRVPAVSMTSTLGIKAILRKAGTRWWVGNSERSKLHATLALTEGSGFEAALF